MKGNVIEKRAQMPPLPEDFKASLISQFGSVRAGALIDSLDTPPSVSVRVNSRKVNFQSSETTLFPDMTPVPWAKGGFRLAERPLFTMHPWLHAGAFYVQEAASMFISEVVNKILAQQGNKPLKVLDLCAAPGGKSIGLIESLPEGSVVVSNEIDRMRASVLNENLSKWGYPFSIITSAAPGLLGQMHGVFDVIVVDAPCSGEGMMRKEHVARSQWSPKLVDQCQSLQRSILDDVIPALRPGGWLVYSTCTFNRKENEENIEWLQSEYNMSLIDSPRRFAPDTDGTEGLFMTLLRNNSTEVIHSESQVLSSCNNRPRKPGKEKNRKNATASLPDVSGWLKPGLHPLISQENNQIWARPAAVAELLDKMPGNIRVLNAGIEVAALKGRDIIPAHPLALSQGLNLDAFPMINLSLQDAVRYLKRESPVLPDNSPLGFVLICYENIPLGFAKNLGNRANSLFPKEWKIRI